MRTFLRTLDLQAKISLVLVLVIIPTFILVTIAQNQLSRPALEEELKQIGITSAKSLAAEIVNQRFLSLPNPTPALEAYLQEFLYAKTGIIRVDVYARDPITGYGRAVATNIEEEVIGPPIPVLLMNATTSDFRVDEQGNRMWEINVPIEQRSRDPKGHRKVIGMVHLLVSLRLVNQILETQWKTTASAAAVSVVLLILLLSYFLRKTIANDRLLRQAESQNLELSEQLHEAQRQLMNTEKLAVMGQLTASFAHEIGTPLNAIGGHLQLLGEELGKEDLSPHQERLSVIRGQLDRIAQIVKNFLQSTAKPPSQNQLVDLNRLADQILSLVRPRSEAMGVDVIRRLDRSLGPVRAVPLELEQIVLNLVNNSLDSLRFKIEKGANPHELTLEISSSLDRRAGKEWAIVSVYDTGEGIRKEDLTNVFKPFYTTKRPGEGTGLGLTICEQLARRQGGTLEIDSQVGAWTRVTLKLPYRRSA